MKFERLRIAGFGRLSGVDVDFAEGLTVVAGPNEAGKSTMVQCLLRLLFGFPESQYNKLRNQFEPWQRGVPYAAMLRYRLDDGRVFEVSRDFSKADVPTQTVEADTRRPVAALTGNKSASPGESAFQFSLDVYRRAAVVSAGDFASESNGAEHFLAERLASIIGSAGNASAAEAIERLKKAYTDIGWSGANTPLGKATREADEAVSALRRYREDYAGLAENIRTQAELTDRVRELTARRARCAAALGSLRLRSVRARITEAADAQSSLAAATARRNAVTSASPAALARRDEIESAIEEIRMSERSAADGQERASSRDRERTTMQREVDAANAALLEKRALVARLDETIAAHEAAAAGKPAISIETLAALEREADEADAAESRARTLDTQAAIERQRLRSSPALLALALIACVAFVAAWFATHAAALAAAAVAAAVVAALSGIAYAKAGRARGAAISRTQAQAAEAGEFGKRSLAALQARCRDLGCANVAAVRAARTAQAELDRIRAERSAAVEAATLLTARRDAVQQRLEDFNVLDADRATGQSRADDSLRRLTAILDEIGIAAGPVDERHAAYRRLCESGEEAARADAATARAREALEKALRGSTIESLEEATIGYAADAASGGDLGEFADRTENEIDRELSLLDGQLRDDNLELKEAVGRIAEFERLHHVAPADLEERAAAALQERDRLRSARDAAEVAWKAIEKAKDDVHRNFTPTLNQAVSRSAAAITGGRYAEAYIDQRDFNVRVTDPQTGRPIEFDALSTGTAEQFQFALRGALAAALGSGERVPILFDDALAHADDARMKAALEHAAQITRTGEQIVFFTQRTDVENLATSLPDARLVRLAGPPA